MRFFGCRTPGEIVRTGLLLGAAAIFWAVLTEDIYLNPQDQAYCKNSISTRGCSLLLKIASEIGAKIELNIGFVDTCLGWSNLIDRNRRNVADIVEVPPVMRAVRRW